MKKALYTIIFLSLALVANASDSFMEKALNSWLNYPLDSVINSWGFPDEEKIIANRHIYIWKKAWSQYIPQYTTSDFYSTTVHSRTSGGYSINYFCQRTLEVNSKNEIIFGEWKGNACPSSYKRGKSLVNPENDEWERQRLYELEQKLLKKQQKEEQKRLKKEAKEKNRAKKI